MAKKIDAVLREQIAAEYLADPTIRFLDLARKYKVSESSVQRFVADLVKAGKCVKPDRRQKSPKRNPDGSKGISETEMDTKHRKRMKAQNEERHPRTTDWMNHITPIHQRKMELENAIEHKQAELEKAKQEYRDFLATLGQLLEESV